MSDEPELKRKRDRSPAYPGISLGHAIERARVFYDKERRSAAPVATVVKHWGFSNPNNGEATVALSALEKFGLIAVDGSGLGRRARLTDLAMTILLNPDQEAIDDAVQKAALLPPIHRQLWNEYGGELPSDETLRYELIVSKRFSERGADNFIGQLRATVAYAKLADPDKMTSSQETNEAEDVPSFRTAEDSRRDAERRSVPDLSTPTAQTRRGGMSSDTGLTTIPLPLVGGAESVLIEGKFPLTETAWDQLLAMLNALKPGLVRSDRPESVSGQRDASEVAQDEKPRDPAE
jgi:hypothetical protein